MRLAATTIVLFISSFACVILGMVACSRIQREPLTIAEACERYDVMHYKAITEDGYQFDPTERSNVAFFPVFPLTSRAAQVVTGLPTTLALWAVSACYLLGSVVLFKSYLNDRFRNSDAVQGECKWISLPDAVLTMYCFFPTTFFLKIPYSESSFLFFTALVFVGMSRHWPLWLLSLIVGIATASRAVGIALLCPLTIHVLSTSEPGWQLARRLAWMLPLATSGIAAYTLYNYHEFGDGFAFAKTQDHWRIRDTASLNEKLLSLASAEPFWGRFVAHSPYYHPSHEWSLLSLTTMNPFFFLGALALVIFGNWKGWITREEFAFAVPLFLIPYLTRAFEWGSLSQARFAIVVFPAYVVMGHGLARLSVIPGIALVAFVALMMGIYAACFAAGLDFF